MDVGVSNAQAAANALPVAPLVGDPAGVAAPVPKFPSLTDVGVGPAQAAADAMGAGGGPAPMSPIAESPFHGRPSDVSMRSEAEPSFDSAGRSDSMGMAAARSSDVFADTEEQEGDHAPGDQIIDTDGEESTEYSISRDGRSLASGSMRLLDTDDEGKLLGDAEGKDSDTKAAIAASGVAAARAVEARLAAQELAEDVYSPAAASRATRFSGLPSETDSSSVNESEVDPMANEDGMPRVRSTTIETETVAAPGPDGTTVVSSTSTFTTRPGEAPPPPPAAGGSGDVGSGGDYEVSASRSAPPPPLVASAVVVPPSPTAPPPPPTASPYSSTVLPGTAPVAAAPSAAGGSQVLSPTDERSVAVVDGSAARAAEVHVTHDYALSGVHEMGVNDGVFLDVNTLATAGADGKVCVWDVDSATVKLQFTPFDNSEAVAVVSALPTAPGAHPQLVCMSARSRLMRIWTLTPDAAVLMSSMQLPRNEKDLIMTLPVAEPAVAEAAMPSGEEDEEGVPTSAPGAMQSDRYSAPVSV
ncbi:hypothetical protein I4F81_008183 [Pyropia yezoensis]|uniref:Uncharacterized protein n=1 Tax=Pyropia yezoensis TaxID=2788 RepID=A0ACC3C5T5_PYRYE|nr:hypothetical protein I4F81_008183 [Neopyropia yezoensis]